MMMIEAVADDVMGGIQAAIRGNVNV